MYMCMIHTHVLVQMYIMGKVLFIVHVHDVNIISHNIIEQTGHKHE